MNARIVALAVSFVVLSFGNNTLRAASITWTNINGGNWSTATNWSPNQVPGASDDALITTPGTYTVTVNASESVSTVTLGAASGTQTLSLTSGTFTVGSASTGNAQGVLNISGGALAGAGAITLAGPLNWSGGLIGGGSGTGGIVNFNGGTFSGSLGLDGGQVVNSGTLSWTATVLNSGNGSIINNLASGVINVTANFSEGNYGGTRTFINAGQFNVAVSGTANISDVFTNTGTVTVNGGTLGLTGGGAESGQFTVASGATLDLGGGTFAFNTGSSLSGAGNFTVAGATATVGVALNLGGTWTFSGGTATLTGTTTVSGNAVNVSGGTVNFNGSGPWQPGTLSISSGALDGTATVTVQNPGGFTWSGGDVGSGSGSGGIVNCNGGTFSGSLSLDGGQVVNGGTLSWTATGFNSGNGSMINNLASGVINVTANFSEGNYGGTRTFNNAGQLNVAVTGTANISDVFTNTGTVNVNGGTLDVSGGGTESGPFTVASGATLDLGSGTFTFNSGATISGAGSFASGATANLGANLQISGAGTFTVSGGTLTAGGTLGIGGNWTFSGGTATLTGTTTVSGNAVTVSGGTVNFDGSGPWQPGTLTISSGALDGTATVTVQNSGGFTWSGGLIGSGSGTGGIVNCNGGTFSGSLGLNGGQVVNSGTLSWTATGFDSGNGSIINNLASGVINVTANFSEGNYGGTRTFNNAGQLNVAVTGTANISDVFTNTGTVTVNGGTLGLTGGGAESGQFTVASGATLDLGGGTFAFNTGSSLSGAGNFTVAGATATVGVALNLGGTWTFSGGTATLTGTTTVSGNAVNVSGGTVNFNGSGPWQPGTLSISSGALDGTATVTVQNPGGFTWSGGDVGSGSGSGGIVNCNGGTFSGSLSLDGGQVVNGGTLSWTATGFNSGNGSMINNLASGVINVTANFSEGNYGGTRTFNNVGQLNVAVTGTANISDVFTNTGTVNVNGGTLDVSGGGTESGPFTVASGATLDLGGGTFTFNTGSSLSGAGNFTVAGATATVGVALNLGGNWTFSSGTANLTSTTTVSGNAVTVSGGTVNFNGSGPWQPGTLSISSGALDGTATVTVQNSGGFTWSGGLIGSGSGTGGIVNCNGGTFKGSLGLNGGEVVNSGPLSWTATGFDSGSGSMINNLASGVINVTTNFSEGNYGGIRTFNNAGQLNVAVTGTANISDAFTNTGTVTINTGTFNLSGSHSLTGGTLNFGINGLNNFGSNILSGAAALAGTLSSTFNGGYLPAVGNSYQIISYGSPSGSFTATNLSPLAAWQVITNATTLTIKVLRLVPQITWPTPADIVYGTALSSTQLDATANWNGSAVSGTFTYNPPLGTVLQSGSNQTLSVTFVPNDTADYTNATATVTINVQKAPLTITANGSSKTYGQTITFAGTEFTTSGLVNGDTITSATLSSDGAASTASVAGSPYSIIITNAVGNPDPGLTNYIITYVNGQLTVNPAPLTITANNLLKTYGQTVIFAGTEFTANGLQNDETVGTVTLMSAGAGATATVAGSPYSIVPSAATGGTFNPGNYTINYLNGTLTVSPAPLTITANSTSKTYGQTVTFAGTEFTTSGLLNADTVTSVTLTSAGAAATATVAGSPYSIVPSAAVGTGLGNYAISYVNGQLTVSPAPLTITANSTSKTYGQTVTFAGTEFTTSGLLNADTVTSVTLSSAGAGATATVAGSPYSIVPSAAVGTGLGNYAISYVNGQLTVSPAPLTITANSTSKTYGQTVTFAGTEFTTSGLLNADTVTSVTLSSAGAAATATVAGSPYSIVPSAAAGTGLGNYTITYDTGQLTVNPAGLTITANSTSKTYGQTVTFGSGSTQFTSSGLQNGETIGSVTLAVSGNGGDPAAPVSGSPYTITPSAATGGTFTPGNYAITYDTGQLTVNAAALTVTASAQSKTYGQTLTFGSGSTQFTSSGLQNGETIGSVTLAVSGNGGDATAPVSGSPYTITPSAATGGTFTAGNYAITYDTGQLTVNTATLTITANSTSKTYGQTVIFVGTEFTTAGLLNGDTVTSVTLTSGGAAATATVAGSPYSIVPSAALGTGLGNYTITYQNGSLTVTPATVTIASGLTADNKVFDGTTTATLSSNNVVLIGVFSGDSVTLDTNGYTASFASVGPGNDIPVTVSGLTLVGPQAADYILTQPTLAADITVPMVPPIVNCPAAITTNSAAGECGQTVAFSVTASGTPTPSVSFQLDGDLITSPFYFPIGTNIVTCTATNVAGTDTCSLVVIVLDSQSPVAGTDLLGTKENQAVNAPVVKLLANDKPGARGGTLSITGVSPISANGGTVALVGAMAVYTPPNNFVGQDQFTYTLSDGGCGTAQGTVIVTVTSASAPSLNLISITANPGANFLQFAGIPGQQYVIQSAPTVNGPWTDLSGTLTVDATGLLTYSDVNPPSPRFYRTRVGP